MNSPTAVAATLRDQILSLTRAPGTPLREVALAEEFACSRRTAREALQLLARDGLVSHEQHRGAAVREFQAQDIRDLYRVRRTLEGQGAMACASAAPELLRTVDAAYEDLARAATAGQDSVAHALADLRFHASVIALIGSQRLNAFFAQIAVEMAYAIRLIQRLEVETATSPADVLLDHARIRDAVLARSPLAAQRAVIEHIEENEPRLLRLLERR